MPHQKSLERMHGMRKTILEGGGETGKRRQHDRGKLTARERIEHLVDPESFTESQPYRTSHAQDFGMKSKHFLGDGVITGSALIGGRPVCLSSQDFTVLGGSLGEEHANRIVKSQTRALQTLCPFIQINDSGGARIQEGIMALDGYGKIFRANTMASGVIPQISLILGPCAGGASYSPALTDFVFMVDKISHMYITGPDVIKTVTGEEVTHEELGGALSHGTRSGNIHFRCKDEKDCFQTLRRLLSYLPCSNEEKPPSIQSSDSSRRKTEKLLSLLPEESSKPYDIHSIIEEIFDKESFLEVQKDFAPSMVIGFARLDGKSTGIIANQPGAVAGVLDMDSSDKAARFIRFCDAFHIPVISLVDVPGYMPGVQQEHGGIIRHGAKLLYAIAEATVPCLALILRKAFGGAYIAMASGALGYDRVLALPFSEIAVMGAEGAAEIVFKKDIRQSETPEILRTIKVHEFQENFMNPYWAAQQGAVDDVIHPDSVRIELIRSLKICGNKREVRPRKKHGNMPL